MNGLSKQSLAPPPFHDGEKAIQSRLGVRERVAQIGARFIRRFLPDQHREFYANLGHIYVAALDKTGAPWASLFPGKPGFITSPSDRGIEIHAPLPHGDALDGQLKTGRKIALLGIDLATRRRNRLNGLISDKTDNRITIDAEQSFGNCPKYIQRRQLEITPPARPTQPIEERDHLPSDLQALITQADIFFIASRSQDMDIRHENGLDISHRGGPPGFVTVVNPQTLTFEDFPGNNFFNTLGNIQSDRRVGLLFLDFTKNRLIQITAWASILWEAENRTIQLDLKRILINPNITLTQTPLEKAK